jgi:hypothetical protein
MCLFVSITLCKSYIFIKLTVYRVFNLFPEGANVAVKKPAKSYLKINMFNTGVYLILYEIKSTYCVTFHPDE